MALRSGDVAVGDQWESIVVDNLSRTQIVQYAGASGDFNPLHTDERFAREIAGYPGVFAHGMLTMALTGRHVTDLVGDGCLLRFGVRFLKQVWPGYTLTSRITVVGFQETPDGPMVDLKIETANQIGEIVASGSAAAIMDP